MNDPLLRLRIVASMMEFCPHRPFDKQEDMIADDRLELFYGGRAGGGKTDALLMAFLKYVHVPHYAGLILRRTFADLNLPGAVMARSHQWFAGTRARWNERDHQWTFPSGATLTFGYMDSTHDHIRYQGAELQFVGMDELTQFGEPQYLYLFSRLRRKRGIDVPLRMRGTGNPGGRGHEWVKRRLVDDSTREPGARFIPSGIDDNPHLGDDYAASLDKLDPVTRAQLKHGDWDINASGNTFKREWWGFVDTLPDGIRAAWRRWDPASTEPRPGHSDPDYLASCKMAVHDGVTYVLHATRDRVGPAAAVKIMGDVAAMDGYSVKIRMEREPGSSGIILADQLKRSVFSGYDFEAIPSTGDKLTRARPLSAAADRGTVVLLRGDWNAWWIDDMATFPTKGIHDDTADAASACFNDVNGRTVGDLVINRVVESQAGNVWPTRERPSFGGL